MGKLFAFLSLFISAQAEPFDALNARLAELRFSFARFSSARENAPAAINSLVFDTDPALARETRAAAAFISAHLERNPGFWLPYYQNHPSGGRPVIPGHVAISTGQATIIAAALQSRSERSHYALLIGRYQPGSEGVEPLVVNAGLFRQNVFEFISVSSNPRASGAIVLSFDSFVDTPRFDTEYLSLAFRSGKMRIMGLTTTRVANPGDDVILIDRADWDFRCANEEFTAESQIAPLLARTSPNFRNRDPYERWRQRACPR